MTDDRPRSPAAVRATYDRIGEHFAETRAHPWSEVVDFCDRIDRAVVALDVGCGNGRHAALLADVAETVVGLDASRTVLGAARARMADEGWRAALLQGDAARLPIVTDTVDVCLSIATVHHLPDRQRRVECLREIRRALAPDGRALVSAWSTAHDRFDAEADDETGFDTTVDWTLPDGETVPRFYHIYALAEFEADLEAAGLTIVDVYNSNGNCFGEVRP